MRNSDRASVLFVIVFIAVTPVALLASARSMYEAALARDEAIRDAASPALAEIRAAQSAYQRVVRRYPSSAYADNALWQAAGLARLAYERFGQEQDRKAALTLLSHLRREYPASSLVRQIGGFVRALEIRRPEPARPPPEPPTPPADAVSYRAAREDSTFVAVATASAPAQVATLLEVQRSPLPDGVRIILRLDREVPYTDVRLDAPPRVFFDFKGVRAAPEIADPLRYGGDIIREIRLGRHPGTTTRIVMPLEGVTRYSTFALYDPYRVVIDFIRGASAGTAPARGPAILPPAPVKAAPQPIKAVPLPASSTTPPPALPAANAAGGFSLARQLGLGLARVVIDPGHGGHDPGAYGGRLSEADVVLDVALRLEKILQKRHLDVVLTRRTDRYVPLEQRTAMANREGADLFLSIHANASSNGAARGVETYFLNFASNPEAEAVAARENAASGRTMHSLPEIVKAIALNNKLDESRDLAGLVQRSMIRRLRPQNKNVKDLGVKQAPFVVLIGAEMPSVLAEISFLTNKSEGALLRTGAYRQRIADALADAVMQYQHALKKVASIAQH
jgi:N-acetylmuramoyl-L-alanine amidase